MSDIANRLRDAQVPIDAAMIKEAADEIDRLHAVQAMEQYWHRQYELARAHIRHIQAAVMLPPADRATPSDNSTSRNP